MIEYFVSGMAFGLAGGFGPGPLMTLVISESLRHGTREGFKVSVAPLITDGPIIAVALLLVDRFARADLVLGLIGLAGAVLVFWIGVSTARAATPEVVAGDVPRNAMRRGILMNALNPAPYLFWVTVGAPTVVRSNAELGIAGPIAFTAAMYAGLVGGKMVTSVIVGRSRHFLSSRVYRVVMIVLGVLLCGYAAVLARDGLALLGLLPGATGPP